jgi:hypothetical protein
MIWLSVTKQDERIELTESKYSRAPQSFSLSALRDFILRLSQGSPSLRISARHPPPLPRMCSLHSPPLPQISSSTGPARQLRDQSTEVTYPSSLRSGSENPFNTIPSGLLFRFPSSLYLLPTDGRRGTLIGSVCVYLYVCRW